MNKIGLTKNLIIDTDMGWDDIIAISLLLKNPNYKIIGITVTGCGETHINRGVELALQLVTLGNRPEIVVVAGADKPTQYDHQFPESFRNIMDTACGLKKYLPKPVGVNDNRSAWQFINDSLDNEENQITILSLGGLTNISRLLEMNPRPQLENINKIVIMGGAVNVDGNVASLNNSNLNYDQGTIYSTNTYAEWNIFLDPIAAQVVFNSEIPIKLVPLDACDYAILDASYLDLITASDPLAKFVHQMIYEKTQGKAVEKVPLPIFDPMAAIEMTNDLISSRSEKMRIAVKTIDNEKDNNCGQTYISSDKSIPEIEVVTAISSHKFKQCFSDAINSPITPLPNHNIQANIAILIFDQVEIQDFAGAFEVFSAARNDDNSSVFNVFTVAKDKNPVVCNAGVKAKGKLSSFFKITPDYTLEDCPKIDTLYIIGGPGIDSILTEEKKSPCLIDWIIKVSKKADYIAASCSGAMLLALTRLMKNISVTTHHTRFDQMIAMSKQYNLGLDVYDTRNAERYLHNPASKYMTSGGVTCGIALALHIVELYQGLDRMNTLATEVLEYTVPRGIAQPYSFKPHNMNPTSFILGFSHLNVVVADLKMMDEATEFYRKTLGFREAWSVWLYPKATERFMKDAGFSDGNGKVMVRFLVHPNAQIHIELMYYVFPKGNQKVSFHKTNDVGGVRHVALEVNNIHEVYNWLKNQKGVQMLSEKQPQKLSPDPQTFFYWIDPYGIQWEMEQGRPMARVVNGIIG